MTKIGVVLYAPSQLNSFLKSNVLSELKGQFQISLFSTRGSISNLMRVEYDEHPISLEIPRLVRKFSGFVQMVSLWKFKDRSMNHLVRAMASFGTRNQQKLWKCVVVSEMRVSFLKRVSVRLASNYIAYMFLRRVEQFLLQLLLIRKVKTTFSGVSALLVPFSGHIGADFGNMVWVARRLKIPVFAIQENWDNLSTKTFILEEPDYFLVWGYQSAGHVRSIHRLFDVEVRIVGSPRFAPYFQKRVQAPVVSSYDGSLTDLTGKNYVLVAGTGDGIDDEMLVRLVAKSIESASSKGKLVTELKIVYRPHPMTRTPFNHESLLDDFANLLVDSGPDSRSFGHHNALVKEAALVVNHFSTLTMEALLSETPVVVPLFLGRPEARYRYEHILNEWHHMMGLGLIPCVKTPRNTEEFSRAIVLVITEGSEKSRVDVDLDWLCKKTDYVTEVSDFVKLRLGNRYDKNALL